MAQWGNTDDAANSVLWAVSQLNKPANTTNQTNLFGNVTSGAFVTGKIVGQFGVDVTEMNLAQSNAAVAQYIVVSGGSGYSANAVVTVANSTGGSNTSAANSTVAIGKVTAVTANIALGGFSGVAPAVTIAAPSAINITANTTGVVAATDFIKFATANSKFAAGDRLYYTVPTNNTAITPLTGNSYYYVAFANTTGIVLTDVPNGSNIDITDTRTTASAEVHTFTGDTATAVAALSGVQHGAAHTGWVLRTVGTGGRAGRVQYETLVAMGGNLSTDAEDTVMKDA
jgi:hypothetical protein